MSVEVKRPDLPKYPRSWLLDINVLSKDILGSMRRTANSEEFNAHHSKWSADFGPVEILSKDSRLQIDYEDLKTIIAMLRAGRRHGSIIKVRYRSQPIDLRHYYASRLHHFPPPIGVLFNEISKFLRRITAWCGTELLQFSSKFRFEHHAASLIGDLLDELSRSPSRH